MDKLAEMVIPSRTCDLKGTKKDEVLIEMVELLSTSPRVKDRDALLKAIFEREKIISTGIGIGVAVPHVKIPEISDFVIAIGRSTKGIDFNALDDKPVHLVVMICASDKQSGEYLKVLAEVIRRCKDKELRRKIMFAKSPEEISQFFIDYQLG